MTIQSLGSIAPTSVAGAGVPSSSNPPRFELKAEEALKNPVSEVGPIAAVAPSRPVAGVAPVRSPCAVGPAPGTAAVDAPKMVEQIQSAQHRMEHILKLAQSGKTFSPSELLSLQAQIYRASQELDLAGKVVEKATGGLKQVLQTQL